MVMVVGIFSNMDSDNYRDSASVVLFIHKTEVTQNEHIQRHATRR